MKFKRNCCICEEFFSSNYKTSRCRQCENDYNKEYYSRPENAGKKSEYSSRYRAKPETKLKDRAYRQKLLSEKPEVVKAAKAKSYSKNKDKPDFKMKSLSRSKTARAIKTGKIVKKPCEICGKEPADAHHDDYSKPLDVRWLCKPHHYELHKLERQKND